MLVSPAITLIRTPFQLNYPDGSRTLAQPATPLSICVGSACDQCDLIGSLGEKGYLVWHNAADVLV